jgi:CubicO group peptidase (beta-lactamase class C family)
MFSSAAVDRLFAPWTRRDSPGAVVGVTRHGTLIHEGSYGMADLAHGIPLDRNSVIRIGSQSKQFTVLLALLLEAEGKLSMDEDVHRYAPWLPEYPHKVTLHHLATNTSGLRDFLEMMVWNGLPLASNSTRQLSRELMARHGEVNFAPGTAMLYSNTGFFLLSEIIEEVSGRSFNELLDARITGRLGLADTRLQARDAEILPRLVSQHMRGPGGDWQTVRWGFPLGGEGGMVSTLVDMLAWQAALAKPPAEWAPLLARMVAPLRYANGTQTLYRMGLVVDRYRGVPGIGHGGGVAGGRSESIRFPEHGLGVVILGNLAELNPFALSRRIADIALADEMAPVPGGEGVLRQAAGLYREEGGGEVYAIGFGADGPGFTSSGGATSVEEVSPGVFAPERPTMHIDFRPAGAGALDVRFCGGAAKRYRRLEGKPAGRVIAGQYGNAGLGLEVRIEGNAFRLRSEVGALAATLDWVDDDLLLVRAGGATEGPWMGTLRVVDGGLVLTTDRTKGLVFRAA